MPSKFGLTASQIEARLKEGRGQGRLGTYKPFITVRDISSAGRSHRSFSTKTGRIHHLLSDLELAVFLTLDWSEFVTDIREQFPLNVDETARLADEAGIRHAAFKNIHQVMTTDFLVDTGSQDRPQFALQAKYAKDLEDKRTIEKLELERRYWQSKGIPWFIVTENDICRDAARNIEWFSPILNDPADLNDLHRYYSLYQQYGDSSPDERLVEIAPRIDADENLEPGEALYWLRHLLGRRYFLFDIATSYQALLPIDIVPNGVTSIMEACYAAS